MFPNGLRISVYKMYFDPFSGLVFLYLLNKVATDINAQYQPILPITDTNPSDQGNESH